MAKSDVQLREELGPDRVKFLREELPGLAEELEKIYNALAGAGMEPSERVLRLIAWVRQESSVLNDPEYDPNFKCEGCGFGTG